MSIRIKRHLQEAFPFCADVFAQTKTIPRISRTGVRLPEAVVRVVVGQMLSSKVADVIYQRVATAAEEDGLTGSWLLDIETLRRCGMSLAKARTIHEFGVSVGANHKALDHWFQLRPDDLLAEIRGFKGMGDWTASIIALFHVGHEDIFPESDGSLRRALAAIEARANAGRRKVVHRIDPCDAAPYRSYLALYLWRALDTGVLT